MDVLARNQALLKADIRQSRLPDDIKQTMLVESLATATQNPSFRLRRIDRFHLDMIEMSCDKPSRQRWLLTWITGTCNKKQVYGEEMIFAVRS